MLKKLFDYLDKLASQKMGTFLKTEIENDYQNLNIIKIQVLENLTVEPSRIKLLKEVFRNDCYDYPYEAEKLNQRTCYLYIKLLQLEDQNGLTYICFLNLDSGYDLVRGEPILWLEKIKTKIQMNTDETYSF